jgi:hypothetical protein
MEWNDPKDFALVSRTFQTWADTVIAKDRATVASIHDEGFRVRLGTRLLTKNEHIELELIVANAEMRLTAVEATRRVGELLLVWSTHFIRVNAIPQIPSLGLLGDWGNEKVAKQGFTQGELSVWRYEGDSLKCIAFDIGSFQPGS